MQLVAIVLGIVAFASTARTTRAPDDREGTDTSPFAAISSRQIDAYPSHHRQSSRPALDVSPFEWTDLFDYIKDDVERERIVRASKRVSSMPRRWPRYLRGHHRVPEARRRKWSGEEYHQWGFDNGFYYAYDKKVGRIRPNAPNWPKLSTSEKYLLGFVEGILAGYMRYHYETWLPTEPVRG